MRLSSTDIVKAVVACAAIVVAVLLWVHRSRQTKVARDAQTSGKIAKRIIGVYTVSVLVLCELLDLPINTFLLSLPCILLMTLIVPFLFGTGTSNAVGFAVTLVVVTPFYVLQQFVLGFPDRDLMVLVPPKVPVDRDPPPRKSETGVVVATLRPMGRIDLAGDHFSAATADGKMLDVGTPIRVCGQRGKVLLVEVV